MLRGEMGLGDSSHTDSVGVIDGAAGRRWIISYPKGELSSAADSRGDSTTKGYVS